MKGDQGSGAEELELTAREFELLEYLLRNKGRLVSREMLAKLLLSPTNDQQGVKT